MNAKTTQLIAQHPLFSNTPITVARRSARPSDRKRIHFCSAMPLLERSDGEEGASYLDLAEVVIRQGAERSRDLEQLWRRVVLFICISNVEDHLRNRGFLLGPRGWTLAPAYDMNPVADAAGLTLNISETDNALDLALAREVAQYFRIKSQRANAIVTEVVAAVRGWRTEAKLARLSRTEQDPMAPAFRVAE